MDRRENNIQIFHDTEQMCRNNARLAEAIQASKRDQYVLAEQENLSGAGKSAAGRKTDNAGSEEVCAAGDTGHRFSEKAKVIVSKKRSFEAASAYARAGERVCVHNFASATNPGGGVVRGSSAQEEALCRCSTLYFCISDPEVTAQFHNLHKGQLREGVMNATYNDDCIYTPGVVVFKSDTDSPMTMPEQDWYEVSVITCAAPNLRSNPSNAMNPGAGQKPVSLKESELMNLHIRRVSRILDIAKYEQADVVILGAFGCGAFCNPPKVVAEAMARVVEQYRFDFKVIEFAVYCTPRDTGNYDAFERRLGRI